MNRKIRKCISELRYFVTINNPTDALKIINDIDNILDDSVIIPKKKLQFVFTKTDEMSPIIPDKQTRYMKCELLSPKVVYCFNTNKYYRENERQVDEYLKELLKNKLIDDWTMIENE